MKPSVYWRFSFAATSSALERLESGIGITTSIWSRSPRALILSARLRPMLRRAS
jgi:hypothetical protein